MHRKTEREIKIFVGLSDTQLSPNSRLLSAIVPNKDHKQLVKQHRKERIWKLLVLQCTSMQADERRKRHENDKTPSKTDDLEGTT